MPKVYNKHRNNAPKGAIYIGRPSPYGNPFIVGKEGNREEVILKFKKYIESNETLKYMVKQHLKGKDLVCYCAPLACHGDILLEIANS